MARPEEIGEVFPPANEADPAAVVALATAADADREPREFTPLERFAAWSKAREARPLNCAYWRIDESGNLMAWGDYGDVTSLHGWMIDHLVPLGHGGTNAIDNLVPIHVSQKPFSGAFFDGLPAGEVEL